MPEQSKHEYATVTVEPNAYEAYSSIITECQDLAFGREKGFNYTYITLNEIFKKVKPIIAKHGYVLIETCDGSEVETKLQYGDLTFTTKNKIIWDDTKKDPQKYGSAVTYARRYGVQQILCIAPDHDDDGVAARPDKLASNKRAETAVTNAKKTKHATDKQVALIEKLLKDRPTSYTLKYRDIREANGGSLPMDEASKMIKALTNTGTK